MEITTDKPFVKENKITAWKDTIKVWDQLVEEGFQPADIGINTVTMRRPGFNKLIQSHGGQCAVSDKRHYRLNSVWCGSVEINFLEVKGEEKQWVIEDRWEPLEN